MERDMQMADEDNSRDSGDEDKTLSIELFPPRLEDLEELTGEAAEDLEDVSYTSLLETTCGVTDDSQPVELYDGTLGVSKEFVDTHQGPVGSLRGDNDPGVGTGFCSGTLISDDLFLTAGHCVDEEAVEWLGLSSDEAQTEHPQEIATDLTVAFNYQKDADGNLGPVEEFDVVELVEHSRDGLDYAILRLDGNPGRKYGETTISKEDPEQGEMLSIIGHPAGRPKRIEAGPTTGYSGDYVTYNDIDTLGGSSGSGVLHEDSQGIIGIHTNGGCTPSSPGPSSGANRGVRVESLIDASPTIANRVVSWSGWESLGGVCLYGAGASSWAEHRLDVFVIGTTSALYHKWWDGSRWNGWENLGGVCISEPAAVSWGNDRIDTFAIGTDHRLYHKWWNGSEWNGWESLGGICLYGPAVSSWTSDRLDVFHIGTNSRLYHKWWDGSGWSGWESLGGVCISEPAAVSWGNDRIDTFVVGTDNRLYHKWWNGSSWRGWESLGGTWRRGVGASSRAPNHLEVFATGINNSLYRKEWDSGWSDWEKLGGLITSAPTAVSWSGTRTDVFAVGVNSALYHKWEGQ